MSDNQRRNLDHLDPEQRRRLERRRRERRRQRRRRALILRAATLAVLILILAGCVLGVTFGIRRGMSKKAEEKARKEQEIQAEEEKNKERQNLIAQAEQVALGYDYDKSIELLKSIENYDKDADLIAQIAEYEAMKSTLTAANIDQVTHIFYHSLVVDPDKAFTGNDSATAGFCQWMTTVDEFNAITQQMYDNGYVLVSLKDLVNETTDEDGTVHFTKGNILLPEGKKPFVLSLDDLSYYHSYDGRGIATKMIIGEDGKPTCEYIQEDGTTVTGAYDCIPLMDAFLEEHPDASYHGAKGTVALTGYNGILGYRTDIAYKTRQNLAEDQEAYLAANPDFDWDAEVAEAKKVAEAIKEDGWDFASHTWGHIRIGDATMENIKEDTEKWMSYVSPLIGGTDTIIFAHGQDLADWHDYSADNEKFSYFKSKGFNYFCNVDSAQYFLQIRDNYVRQGRRNLDGYRLWNDVHGEKNRTSDLFDAATVLDPKEQMCLICNEWVSEYGRKKEKKTQNMREEDRQRILERRRRERARQRKRKAMMMRAAVAGGLVLILILAITAVALGVRKGKQDKAQEKARQEQALKEEEEKQKQLEDQLAQADRLAAGYDYDGAIKLLQDLEEKGEDVQAKIDECEAAKSTLVAADVETIPHVFFHILVADPSITWNLSGEDEYKIADYNQVMTTIDEFKGILQQMYDRGYVLVRLHDLVEETKNEEGETVFTEGKIMLPEGKKPFVMSQDDVCYYFYMIGDGYASKMVVGEDGRPTTEYINSDGSTVTGPYDLVPVLNEFIDEHPDFSYKGAKAVLAFTGYNGVLGYRTDPDLAKTAEEGNEYAEEYGTFDYKAEIEAAKPVVQALKDDGWELASHSYGHISYGSSFEKVKEDADKWQERVANVIGPTDILIFPFGTDIGSWNEYTNDNQTYQYLHDQGFRFFCNVDSNPYWVQIREDYVRQGRRNLDGYRMYQDLYNGADKLSDLFDVSQVFDKNRPEEGLQVWDGAE